MKLETLRLLRMGHPCTVMSTVAAMCLFHRVTAGVRWRLSGKCSKCCRRLGFGPLWNHMHLACAAPTTIERG